MSRAEDHIRSRVAGSDQYYMYAVDGRDDFVDYVMSSDQVSRTQTGFKKMTMAEVAKLHTRYSPIHVKTKVFSLVSAFWREQRKGLDPLSSEFEAMTKGFKPRSQRYRAMAKLYSMHQLQKEQFFTSPITAALLPSGKIKVEPGTTRMLFSNRPERVDVMLSNYFGASVAWDWTHTRDYEMMSYEGLSFGSYPFLEKDVDRWEFHNPNLFHKELIADINANYRIQDIIEPFEYYDDENEIRINGVPLIAKVDGIWEIVSYDR